MWLLGNPDEVNMFLQEYEQEKKIRQFLSKLMIKMLWKRKFLICNRVYKK